ncbi:MAG: sodium:solute symporter [Pyrinomonadaceae bacterium]
MRPLDWLVLCASLAGIVLYGIWKGRRSRDLDDYLVADRSMRWHHVALSIMATQASAITFLSTPGQGYADGMRFVQFYLGLPVAMVVLSITVVPVYRRLKVYTAYEYLEGRFDLKTRTLAASLFLLQRALSTGVSIYAPSVILSVIMGWDIRLVILLIGGMVTIYTTIGGARAVDNTNFQQFLIIMGGMLVAFLTLVWLLPADVSLTNALHVAGKLGRLNAIDFSFKLDAHYHFWQPRFWAGFNEQYNFWSGLVGGCFLALSYFGTDQSQVQRYLTGESVTQSRLGLLFNGLVKVPMQFFILLLGAMVFAFYQFTQPPIFHNPVEVNKVLSSPHAAEFRALEAQYGEAFTIKRDEARKLAAAIDAGADGERARAENALQMSQILSDEIRADAIKLIKENDPDANTSDTNYVFLNFVIHFMPAGVVGLIFAAVFFASMSSTASALNALASTTVIDVYRRLVKRDGNDRSYFIFSKLATVFWGAFSVAFAEYAGHLGSLIEAVNRLGSLFYGTMLGIFLLAFYFKRIGGTATFVGAIIGEAVVLYCFFYTPLAFLWYNVVGALVVIIAALALNPLLHRDEKVRAAG